jgi:hypothetical protein
MKHGITLSATLVCMILLGGCYVPRGGPYKQPSYSELKNLTPLTPAQEEELYGECPRPNGLFESETETTPHAKLYNNFWVEESETPAIRYPGGTEDDAPLPSVAYPIHLLGSERKGAQQRPPQKKGDLSTHRLILELRPLGPRRFRIGLTTTTGLSVASDRGILAFKRTPVEQSRCENGVMKTFGWDDGKNGWVLSWTFHVEPQTGDVVIAIYNARAATKYLRYKRIGN